MTVFGDLFVTQLAYTGIQRICSFFSLFPVLFVFSPPAPFLSSAQGKGNTCFGFLLS